MVRVGGSSFGVTVAGHPPHGRGVIVEPLADGCIVALGSASQTGFDDDYELGDAQLRILVEAAAGPGLEHGYAAVVAELREVSERCEMIDERLPSMNAIVAVCSSGGVELSWVGRDKAYVVRGREIIAETSEHSFWRTMDAGMREQVQARMGRMVLGVPTRSIAPHECLPESLRLPALEAGDALLLVSGGLHWRASWRAGVERALGRLAVLDAATLHRELCRIAAELDELDEWGGPVAVIG